MNGPGADSRSKRRSPPTSPLPSRVVADASVSQVGRPYPPPAGPEAFWPIQLTVLAAIALQFGLPEHLTVGPTWLVPSLEGVLLLGLSMATPRQL